MKTAIKQTCTSKIKHVLLLKKLALLLLACIFYTGLSFGQDIILLKSTAIIKSKIIEVADAEIKFKNFDNLEGPTRVISKSQVVSITYENGVVDNFQNYVSTKDAGAKKEEDTSDFAKIKPKIFGGPRFGCTYITEGSVSGYLADLGKQPFTSQFGWQFEKRLFTLSSGLSGVVEFVPLIGGVEKGIFSPSCSALIGIRGLGFGKKNLFEFALGPTISGSAFQTTNNITKETEYKRCGAFGVVLALGANISKENVNFPITIAYVPSVGSIDDNQTSADKSDDIKYQTGHRISLLIGFNYRKK